MICDACGGKGYIEVEEPCKTCGGTGKARTFLDLVKNTFLAMEKKENISFIPTPEDIRDKYQYFTEAQMSKLRSIGYDKSFTSLEDGVKDYVQNYLIQKTYN
jgi:ADP-L-glycero-D-manno-heptose 6-epimerase